MNAEEIKQFKEFSEYLYTIKRVVPFSVRLFENTASANAIADATQG